MNRGHLIARALLKQASLVEAGKSVGNALVSAGHGAGKVIRGTAQFGGGVGRAIGGDNPLAHAAGATAALGGLGVAVHKGGKELNDQQRQLRAQHGLLTANEKAMYGYY